MSSLADYATTLAIELYQYKTAFVQQDTTKTEQEKKELMALLCVEHEQQIRHIQDLDGPSDADYFS